MPESQLACECLAVHAVTWLSHHKQTWLNPGLCGPEDFTQESTNGLGWEGCMERWPVGELPPEEYLQGLCSQRWK